MVRKERTASGIGGLSGWAADSEDLSVGAPHRREAGSLLFPLDCFTCCPRPVRAFLPSTWLKFQDKTHFSLFIGEMACLALVIRTVITVYHGGCFVHGFCIRELVILVFIVPISGYLAKIIETYDDRLQHKQKEVQAKKECLTRSYNELLLDMDGLLSKSAESSAGLAERSFESKRRDFQRFLDRAKSRYQNVYVGTKVETDALLKQFRQFCLNWLSVFEECSIDPIDCPKRVVTSEELYRCTNIGEVCDICLERLRVTEVRFISIQRDQDAQMLRKNRNEFRRITRTEGSSPNGMDFANARNIRSGLVGVVHGGVSCCSWLTLGRGIGISCNDSVGGASRDGYPKECRCCCVRLVMLSAEHVKLLISFSIGCLLLMANIALFYFIQIGAEWAEGWSATADGTNTGLILLVQVALVVMLTRFEEIDTIQQLEREVLQLTQNTQQVEAQRERMRNFWSNAQQLTELWLYRTVPRLDLYKEMHSQLEDCPTESLLVRFTTTNLHLEALDKHLGALEAWRNGGAIGLDVKKQFGKDINKLCQEQQLDDILVKLEDVTRNGMKALQNAGDGRGVAAPGVQPMKANSLRP